MMPDNTKRAPDPNARLLASMGSLSTGLDALTRELGRLTEHQASAEDAATQRAADLANAASLSSRSRTGTPTVPATVTTANGAATAMAALQNLNQMRQSPPDKQAPPDRSSPPGSQIVEPEDLNNPSPGEALTFAMLGAQGGPFGNLRMRQYMLQRNLGWAQNVLNKSSDWVNTDQPSTLGNVVSSVPGLSQILGWAGSSKDENGQLTGGLLSKVINPQTGNLTGLGTGGLVAYTAAAKAIDAITGWQRAGLDLGYGNEQSRGILGFRDPLRQTSATKEGLALTQERLALEGRLPKFLGGSGLSLNTLTSADATSAVGTLAAQGFGEQNGPGLNNRNMVNGDNYRIAQNLMAPLMNMGLTAQDAAQWTPALRNANTSMQTLMETLQQVPAAARAAKLTVGEFNASLTQTAQTSVSQGGTLQGGAQMGMAFTESTGMAPALGGAISQNPIYQSLMMGRYGVLPSGIPNLSGGAQVQGMLSAFNMLRGAFSGLNKDRFETVGGVKLHTAYGFQMQDAQIAQTLGVDQSTINRLRRESRSPQIANILGELGNAGSQGMPGTGIWEILGRAQDWGHLSQGQRSQASHVWNAILGNRADPNSPIHQLGLSAGQIKDIYGTGDVRQRMDRLQKDLLGSQQTDKSNSITVYVAFKGEASKHFKQAGPSSIKLNALSGQGQSMNSLLNSPLGDAAAANNQPGIFSPFDVGTPTPSNTP